MKRQVEDWHPAGIQVTGEKKLKIESGMAAQKVWGTVALFYL